MTSRDFCYWLQGYFEIAGIHSSLGIPRDQAEKIERHLKMVFAHDIDPSIDKGDAKKKLLLDSLHETGFIAPPKDMAIRC